jgi:ferredoxin
MAGNWRGRFFLDRLNREVAMKVRRKIIEIDEQLCDGCGLCVPSCAEGAIQVVDGKARLVAEKFCDGLGACLGECPNGALRIVEREAEDFDEQAVEAHLETKKPLPAAGEQALPCGCPSVQVQSLPGGETRKPRGDAGTRTAPAQIPSSLANWPVQIALVPATAPFLKGADLLVVADCVGIAYPNVHTNLLPGKVVLMGCPKLDNAEMYVQKFVEIFKTAGIKSVTTVMMEVPCCSGLLMILKKALSDSGKKIPLEEVVVGIRGDMVQAGGQKGPARSARG